jgi:hypothetical protein
MTFLQHVGNFFKSVFADVTHVATAIEPVVDVAFPGISTLYNATVQAVATAETAATAAGAATGSGTQKAGGGDSGHRTDCDCVPARSGHSGEYHPNSGVDERCGCDLKRIAGTDCNSGCSGNQASSVADSLPVRDGRGAD